MVIVWFAAELWRLVLCVMVCSDLHLLPGLLRLKDARAARRPSASDYSRRDKQRLMSSSYRGLDRPIVRLLPALRSSVLSNPI